MLVSSSVAERLLSEDVLYNAVTLHFPLNSNISDITSANIVLSSLELDKQLMDGSDFKFGGCVASEMKIKLVNYKNFAALEGETVQAIINTSLASDLYPSDTLYPSATLYPNVGVINTPIFYGKIESLERDVKNRGIVTLTAYDAFHDMANYDITNWFAIDGGSTYAQVGWWEFQQTDITFADMFAMLTEKAEGYGITGIENYSSTGFYGDSGVDINALNCRSNTNVDALIKDITLVDLIQAYAELKLTFATINPKGQLAFTPLGSSVCQTVTSYKDLTFENYETQGFSMLSVAYTGAAGTKNYTYLYGGSNDASWYNMNNLYIYGGRKSSASIHSLAAKYDSKLFGSACVFRPAEVKLFSYWWLEPGDKIKIVMPKTGFDDMGKDSDGNITITTFVFGKQMSGFETTLKSEGERLLGKSTDAADESED